MEYSLTSSYFSKKNLGSSNLKMFEKSYPLETKRYKRILLSI